MPGQLSGWYLPLDETHSWPTRDRWTVHSMLVQESPLHQEERSARTSQATCARPGPGNLAVRLGAALPPTWGVGWVGG